MLVVVAECRHEGHGVRRSEMGVGVEGHDNSLKLQAGLKQVGGGVVSPLSKHTTKHS